MPAKSKNSQELASQKILTAKIDFRHNELLKTYIKSILVVSFLVNSQSLLNFFVELGNQN